MSDIEIRPRALDDDPHIVRIRNESNASWPPATLEEYRYQADPANNHPGKFVVRNVAVKDGDVVGLYVLAEMEVERPHTFYGNIGVDVGHRNGGIGGLLYDDLLRLASQQGANRIYCSVQDDTADRHFLESRGFAPTGRVERLSRLDVSKANLDGYEAAEDRIRAEGLETRTLGEIGVDDANIMQQIFDVEFESARDIPTSEPFTPPPFDVWRRSLLEAPGAPGQDRTWLGMDGEKVIGLALQGMRGNVAGFNSYTGVLKQYRGRGIARALKLKTIEYARSNGISHIFTGNDVDNERMLSINIRLGYEPVPAQMEFVKDL
jgi:GNAT superfamily N-acetyltransferase